MAMPSPSTIVSNEKTHGMTFGKNAMTRQQTRRAPQYRVRPCVFLCGHNTNEFRSCACCRQPLLPMERVVLQWQRQQATTHQDNISRTHAVGHSYQWMARHGFRHDTRYNGKYKNEQEILFGLRRYCCFFHWQRNKQNVNRRTSQSTFLWWPSKVEPTSRPGPFLIPKRPPLVVLLVV